MNFVRSQLPQDQRRSRRFPRYRTDLKLTVEVLGAAGYFRINGLCNQIGEGGLGAIISSELTIGDMVNLQLSVPGEAPPVSVRAVVRWRERLQHGFEFFGPSPEDRTRIRDYCKTLTEQSPI